MRLTIVLPSYVTHPIGGFKVAYQYANGLVGLGHHVTVVQPASPSKVSALRAAYRRGLAKRSQRRAGRGPVTWFDLDPRIEFNLVGNLSADVLPTADVTLLTSWETAAMTPTPPGRAGTMAQLVQDYEHWRSRPDEREAMERALQRPDVHVIAISTAVVGMLESLGKTPVGVVPNGLDDGEFGVDVPVEDRRAALGFSFRGGSSKGMGTVFPALGFIRERYPAVGVSCFGDPGPSAPPPPPWVEQLGRVSQEGLRSFYNRCSIFLLPSDYEGWGLPAAEAMACGSAVVSTRNGGSEDFIRSEQNGLLIAPGAPDELADQVCRLLADDDLRARLAKAGAEDMAKRTVAMSVAELERVLLRL